MERMALLHRSPHIRTPSCDHPDPLSEPRSAASIKLPCLTKDDVLRLPPDSAQKRISSLQLETACYAARRFRMALPDGRTAGYVLGDGTGCGKGRIISTLLFHMWNSGYRRSVWVSATNDLYHDACRDLADLGADIPCVPMRRLPPGGPLDKPGTEANRELIRNLGLEGDGIIFLTYSLLVQTGQRRKTIAVPIRTEDDRRRLAGEGGALDERLRVTRRVEDIGGKEAVDAAELLPGDRVVGLSTLREVLKKPLPFTLTVERVLTAKDAKGSKKGAGKGDSKDDIADYNAYNSRVGQLVAWLGGDKAGGLICFDEVHKAKNLVPDKDDHASTKTGLFVDMLQQYCPKAPVLYVSATAATEVKHLGYMSRLGLWGPGTAFEDFHDFSSAMERGGVGAMEMVAINAKALGALSCKALSYSGTEFALQKCGLTKEQSDTYDAACRFWQNVLSAYKKFISSSTLKETYKKHFFKNKKDCMEIEKRLWQFLWGSQQRFFKALCNSMKVPAAVAAARDALDRGEQVVMSIWATGEARSTAKMAKLKKDVPGRVKITNVSEGGLVHIELKEKAVVDQVIKCLNSSMRLRNDVSFMAGKVKVARLSRLATAHGRRVTRPEDLDSVALPVPLVFRSASSRRFTIDGTLEASGEKVQFELCDDQLGERVIVGKVSEGPPFFRRAELDGWHVKTINGRPIGKLNTVKLAPRLRKEQILSFQDAIVGEHLSGPQMIAEHFLKGSMLTDDPNGVPIPWAVELKQQLTDELATLKLPPNAMDEIIDSLGGLRNVAELSGRSHRMRRRKDGTLAWVARSEELRCTLDGANLVEQVLFQKGVKKVCLVTEVASAGISLHADRRQVRKGFQPPRRVLISVELPWGADKSIQVFGRVHRANQLVPPRFLTLCTPLGGEVRFSSAIARRMKLLGAVTKGDRLTSMGGVADKHMCDFDINNAYGARALYTVFRDTNATPGSELELGPLYSTLPFLGKAGDGPASGRWTDWWEFAAEMRGTWRFLNLIEDMEALAERVQKDWEGGGVAKSTRECCEMNRFLNRILMLDIELQNGVFEAFFAVYEELVQVDRANGVYDEGVENLNRYRGRTIHEIWMDSQEVLHKDPVSGAETQYVRLRLDRGIPWEAAKDAYDSLGAADGPKSVEGFYSYHDTPDAIPVYVLVKERVQAGASAGAAGILAGRRRRQYVVWRPDLGVSSGDAFGRHAYLAEDFTEDDRFVKLGASDADLRQAEKGWTQLYEASAQGRMAYDHLLTGDVIAAWRLVMGSAAGAPGGSIARPRPQIVRAVTKPEGLPVVGLRVHEEDIPNLRYVLSCQHSAFREREDSDMGELSAAGIRALATNAAEALLERLQAAENRTLPFKNWLDVHKALAADALVPRDAVGMRAVQSAVDLLVRKRLITAENGTMMDGCEGKRPTGTSLEMALFPEEFVDAPREGGGSGSDEDEEQDDFNFSDLEFSDLDDDNQGAKGSRAPARKLSPEEAEALEAEERERKEIERLVRLSEKMQPELAAPTPARTKRGRAATAAVGGSSDAKPAKKPRRPRGGAAAATGSPPAKAPEAREEEDDDAVFDELFGDIVDGADAAEETNARQRQRIEMSKALFGDSDEDMSAEDA
eukprot:TRINITY_DN31509_c0_g1_i1.p1 TRINITY_DN31509_c0_g1~~TRINITY_DN31509_c0_g1_i1.p1  ORF type:complete len:1880 (+),score=459.56 TRINITY_DN31509_c0_g1_i1:802-5640(+)